MNEKFMATFLLTTGKKPDESLAVLQGDAAVLQSHMLLARQLKKNPHTKEK